MPAQLIYEAASDGMWVMRVDPNDRFIVLSVNRAYTALTGVRAEELVGKAPGDLLSAEDAAHVLERHRAAVQQRKPIRYEESIVVGRRLTVETTLTPVFNEAGVCTHILGTARDISEQKAAEEEKASLENQLRDSKKLEAIGTLAAGIAQEFSGLLTIIQGHIDVARKDARRSQKVLKSLGISSRACRNAHVIARQILEFSGQQPVTRQVRALPAEVRDALELLRAALPPGHDVECQVIGEIPAVLIDPVQLQQVILSLGIHASQAMVGASATIRLRVDAVRVTDSTPGRARGMGPGLFARVSITDSGGGMDPGRTDRLFEPVVRGDLPGGGDGLGLYVVHNIVVAHRGAITVQSTPGTGTTLSVYLPAAPPQELERVADEQESMPGVGRRPHSRGAGQRILYVDDQNWLLALVERVLTDQGYEMVGFVDPKTALDALHERPDDFDLVVTDYKMPGFTGFDIARAAKAIRPDLPIIIASAYISNDVAAQAARAGADAVVYKPLLVQELGRTVARLLGESAAESRT